MVSIVQRKFTTFFLGWEFEVLFQSLLAMMDATFLSYPYHPFICFCCCAENVYITMVCAALLSHRLSDTVSNHIYLVHLAFYGNLSCIKVPICSIQWAYRWQDLVQKILRYHSSSYTSCLRSLSNYIPSKAWVHSGSTLTLHKPGKINCNV